MKYCPNCGTTLSDDAVFCAGCGVQLTNEAQNDIVSHSEPAYKAEPVAPQPPVYQAPPPAPNNAYNQPPVVEEKKNSVSVMGYIGRSLIPYIPFVGGLIYFIMLFIWGADKTKEDSFRNWAKAQLWMTLIGIGIAVLIVILYIVLAVVMGVSVAGVATTAPQMVY